MIYMPSGRAREYADYAINQYRGCQHGCTYCYVRAIRHEPPGVNNDPEPIGTTKLNELKKEAPGYSGKVVTMSFLSDPYQPCEARLGITRQILEIFYYHKIIPRILSKAGSLPLRDIDLIAKCGGEYGATLTCDNEKDSLKYEPGAALPSERIETLRAMHERGIKTWVSCEPVIDPEQTTSLIRTTAEFVDLFKIGKINYQKSEIDWVVFRMRVRGVLAALGKKYYIKRDLLEEH